MKKVPGLVVVVSGPSGAGKSTVCRRLAERCGYALAISATTRPPRAGEVDGRDYFFLGRGEFKAAAERGEFLEHSEHFDNLYGTPKAQVEEALKNGRVALLEIDVNGAEQVRKLLPDAFCLFLTAPDDEENIKRLKSRCSEDESSIRTRLQRAEREKAEAMRYDKRIVNDDLEETVRRIHEFIDAEVRKRHGS